MVKIGILVFSGNDIIKAGRAGRKHYYYDSFEFKGMNRIKNELTYEYGHVSKINVNDYDFVLVSLISYHDILNLINTIPLNRRCKVIVGGPACNNIRGFIDYIDIANFGRCDAGKINAIINGDKLETVWRKDNDPHFEQDYFVDNAIQENLVDGEKSVGCQQKCTFCLYSWWNGYVGEKVNYTSGFSNYEDFFHTLDWEKCKRGAVTGLDGVTEETRIRVKKFIRKSDITKALLKSNKVDFDDKKLRLKVYCVVGYPWESENEISKLDLIDCIKDVESELKNRIVFRMHFSHFIPFQKTPLWFVEFSFNDYRAYNIRNNLLYQTDRIQCYSGGSYTPSPAGAGQSTIIQRAFNSDCDVLRILASKKFQNLPSWNKINIMRKELNKFFIEQEQETIGNIKSKYNRAMVKMGNLERTRIQESVLS